MAHLRSASTSPRTDSTRATVTPHSSTPLQQRLESFVGKWHMEGFQLASPLGAAAKIAAVQTYEWLHGGSVLIHRFDGHVGDSSASCIEVIGCERDTGRCRVHSFYDNGSMNVWDVEEHDGRWRLFGDWNMHGKSMKVRSTITFSDAGKTMHANWEHSKDGSKWHTFWDANARKALGN